MNVTIDYQSRVNSGGNTDQVGQKNAAHSANNWVFGQQRADLKMCVVFPQRLTIYLFYMVAHYKNYFKTQCLQYYC